MNITLNEEYILSIRDDLINLPDFIPLKINGVLAIHRELNWNRNRGLFLQNNHPEVIKEMYNQRAKLTSFKSSEEREKISNQQVIEFVEKYPEWENIILK